MRADKAEFCLQLRHIEKMFQKILVNRPDGKLSADERLNVSLAYQFVNTPIVAESNTKLDQTLVEKIKATFQIKTKPPKEECLICQKPIPFEKREDGQCSSGHRALYVAGLHYELASTTLSAVVGVELIIILIQVLSQ